MNMKKTFILLFVAILPLLASAQKEEVKVTVVEEESTLLGVVLLPMDFGITGLFQ